MEAMACACPVLGANVGGIPDLIRDGNTGYLFRAGDIDDLASKLNSILTNSQDAKRVGQQAQCYLEDNLTWQSVVRKMRDQVYMRL